MHSFPWSKIGLAPSTGPLNCTIGSKHAPAGCTFGAGQYKDAVDGALVSERADQDRPGFSATARSSSSSVKST
ncbi:hypothetical protein KNN17_05840 [Arthrobacter bambusae]|uniref:hypothetical protein n=1 Tax=Arthrobacter bambusae TaxID=1338426 RepID=UPI001F505F5F|nr:hypothetical protein [Arthrobacter bambusae]MCI0141098.1 hypothetical protein [Arthrobacter bambusae]